MDSMITKKIFNTPIEIGLRLSFILGNTNRKIDQQRLVYYSYLIVHSSDVDKEKDSLHANLPNRSCEILVSRKLIFEGLKLLISRGLINVSYSKKSGLSFGSNKETKKFISQFQSNYSRNLQDRALWVIKEFENESDKKLTDYINKNLGEWGAEFTREYSLEE